MGGPMNKLLSNLYHVCFVAAFALAAIAVLEGALQLLGQSILRGSYTPGRLIEFAGILMIFVIALQLRQIRDKK